MKPVPVITDMNRDYFEGCSLGELRVRHCPRCNALFRFMHEWCPQCWSLDLSWKRASGRGKLDSFSVVHQAPYAAFESSAPYVLALIELDEGVRLMSNVIGCSPDDVRVGMPLQVVFERRGDVVLPMFEPIGDGAPAERQT